jgi:hypothetical protein
MKHKETVGHLSLRKKKARTLSTFLNWLIDIDYFNGSLIRCDGLAMDAEVEAKPKRMPTLLGH